MARILFICLTLIGLNYDTAWSSEEDQIVVRLETDVQLMPVYLSGMINEDSGFQSGYLKRLEQVLQFDLNNNGMTYTVKHDTVKDALAHLTPFENMGDASKWKTQNVYYVIKTRIQDRRLSARVLSTSNQTIKEVKNLQLTGEMSDDRELVHFLADSIHQALFGTVGIASTRILYTVKTKGNEPKQWLSEVWEADYDGENARQITEGHGYCVTPIYIPPKEGHASGSFFFVSYQNGQPKIYVASLKDGQSRRFSYMKGNQLMPAISTQRDKVSFICDITGNPDLFLQPFTMEEGLIGKPQQIFSTHQATQGSPSFSPDGKQIAFVSNKDGSPRIYIMPIPAAGTRLKDIQAKLISKSNRENTAPAWSPDGTKLAYCAMTGGVRQIWIYDFEKGIERQITQGGGNKENPSWAPNSLHLVFNSTGNEDSELYLINLNQPQTRKISQGPGEKRFPCWEPRAG